MAARKLPIGIQTFREIRRDDGYYYVDKTEYVRQLIDGGKHYFLSRPRRFGKSLLLDTIKEVFAGSEALFRGLAIHDRDWSARHPVVRLEFGSGSYLQPGGLHEDLMAQLEAAAEDAGIAPRYDTAPVRFRHLIRELRRQAGQPVVVLVDEYDKPILDALEAPAVARANRDYLRGLYGAIKSSDADLRFTFLTGVSKFSKVSLFSGLNNLTDITLDPRYSAICGYVDADLDAVFAPELAGLDRGAVRAWYDGYSWRGEQRVYNPFDILMLFRTREFNAWWFETGTPAFLVDTLFERRVSTLALDDMLSSDDLLSAFDVGHVGTEALLFQTGYLTIRGAERRGNRTWYRLGYPNLEVRQSLNEHLLNRLTGNPSRRVEHSLRLYDVLHAQDFAGLQALFEAFFASIPYEWYTNNDIAAYEGYYASVFYSYFAGLELDVTVEDASSHGRVDMAVRFAGAVYLFEFKVVELEPAGAALAQLRARRYADKYRALGQPIYLIGVEFSKETRNLAAFDVERA